MDPADTVKLDPRRGLPQVDALGRELRASHPELVEWAVRHACRRAIAEARRAAEAGEEIGDVTRDALERASRLMEPHPRRVINATGVVLHTNLGRAPLSPGAAEAVRTAAVHYSDLELSLEAGRRGDRLGQIGELLCAASGAEAATAVNNNAAALLLLVNTLAAGKQVVVSRGELVEIGGSFRVPDILSRAGVVLREVGTTNRTHLRDYQGAIGPETGLLLKVHPSNFQQQGYVKEVDLAELVEVGRKANLPVVEDLGSGLFGADPAWGLPSETDLVGRLKTGVDAVCVSGDKLLGGPQAGMILGTSSVVQAVKANPLARALRLDKLSIAALDATLREALSEEQSQRPPIQQQIAASPSELAARAESLRDALREVAALELSIEVETSLSPVGGGSVPGYATESRAVALRGVPGGPDALGRRLREAAVPVLTRIRDGAVLFDVRSLLPGDEKLCVDALRRALTPAPEPSARN